MPTTVEFDQDPLMPPELQATESLQGQPYEEDAAAMAAVYQQIADRRAQLENAEVLRRARSL
jgi:hypothetical protein